MNRRDVLKGAAWSIPVIAASATVPVCTASTVTPVECVRLDVKGQPFWQVFYSDGTDRTLSNGDVNRDKGLQAVCRGKGSFHV